MALKKQENAAEKNNMRQSMERAIRNMTDEDRKSESRNICDQLLSQIAKNASVCGYAPLKNEVNINPLLTQLCKRGNTLCLPRHENGVISFHRVENIHNLEYGPNGILEPPKGNERIEPNTIDIVLIPGRAFTKRGDRLGRGGGAYDKWLKEQRQTCPETKYIGIAFSCQLVPKLPMEKHDQRVDIVMTANG